MHAKNLKVFSHDSEMNLSDPALIIIDDTSIIDEDSELQLCGDSETYTLWRFVFLFVSSWIACLGIIGNVFLIYLFSTRHYPNTPPTLYPGVLAVLDALICAMYILLFGADAAIGFLHLEQLFVIYHIYIVPAFVIARITQLAIPYMLIFATLERFVWIVGAKGNKVIHAMYSPQGRQITMIMSLVICILLRLPTFWAITVYEYPDCDDFFRTKTTSTAPWVQDSLIYHIYDFHLLSITQTFVPFVVLLTFNFVIVKRLCFIENDAPDSDKRMSMEYSNAMTLKPTEDSENSRRASTTSVLLSKRRMNPAVKSAIYTMVAIVTSYLLSNSLHLILTVLERSNSALLRHPTDPNLASTFHTAFSDTVSFVYMFTSAIRLVIYYFCNAAIRNDVKAFFKDFWRSREKNSEITPI